MLKRQKCWKDFIIKSENFMKNQAKKHHSNLGKTISISKEKYSCYKNKNVGKASTHVYFIDNHESIMISSRQNNVIL